MMAGSFYHVELDVFSWSDHKVNKQGEINLTSGSPQKPSETYGTTDTSKTEQC